jgi:hypothetical protein
MVNRKIVNEFMETKKKYIKPRIEWILLDNEISLALASSPPEGPSETFNSIQSPFKESIGLVKQISFLR